MNDNEITVSSYQGGPSEVDRAAEDAITSISKQFDFSDAVETDPVDTLEASPESATEQTNTVEAPKPGDVSDRGLERLVEREVALRARESELSAKERQFAELSARMKELEARAIPQDLSEKFGYAPEDALRAMGLDPDMIVEQVIANRMGKDAPPEVQGRIRDAGLRKELSELRNQLTEHQRMIAAQNYVTQVQTGAREYITRGLTEQALPTLSSVAKTNPERVYREIMEEISADARTRASGDPNGEALPYQEAAKRVEQRWAEFKTILSPGVQPTSTTGTATAPPKAPSNPSVKPPERPIAPWLQRTETEEAGINAALAAWRKAEQTPR